MTLKSETPIIILLACINFVNIVDFMVLMPLAAQIKAEFGLLTREWGLVVSSYTISAFLAGVLALFMIDRFNRKSYLLWNMVGFVIGTLLCGFASSYYSMLFARIVTGFFGGVIGSTSIAILSDIVPIERRGRAMGIFMGGFSAAAALGVPFGTVLGAKDTFGWNFPFLALTILGAILTVITLIILPKIVPAKPKDESESHIRQTLNILKDIGRDKNQLTGFWLMMLLALAQFLIVPFFSPYLMTNLGLNQHKLAGVYFVGGITSIVTSPYIGKLSDRYGHIKVFTVMALMAVVPIWLCTSMEHVSYPFILFAAALFFACVGGRFTPAIALMISTAKPHQRGVFNTLRNSVQNGIAGLGAFLAGIIITQVSPSSPYVHYEIAGYIAIVINLYCIWVIRKMRVES